MHQKMDKAAVEIVAWVTVPSVAQAYDVALPIA
jgi:hypothetical protein